MKVNDPITLYIFVTSDTPDLYINIIGYCVDQYKVIKVVFLGIVEDRGQKERAKYLLTNTKERVIQQLSLIQQGQYLYRDQKTSQWQQKNLNIENYNKLRYSKIADQDIDIHVIIYETLDDELTDFLKLSKCVFDTSGVLKTFLIDVYTLLLTKGIDDIYVFELRLPRRTYDEQELIHNLSFDNRDYEYVNISKSRYTSGTMIKTRLQEDIDRFKINSVNNLIETIAERFARNVLAIYALVVLAIFIWITILVVQGNWNELEPWTFLLLALLPYLINIVAMIFFKKELSLSPKLMYDWLKNYKLRSFNTRLNKP